MFAVIGDQWRALRSWLGHLFARARREIAARRKAEFACRGAEPTPPRPISTNPGTRPSNYLAFFACERSCGPPDRNGFKQGKDPKTMA
jgi:hypothetical protein